ncbi:hypothetical protein V8C86DRAFT_2508088 [Haematococcus lacustris]
MVPTRGGQLAWRRQPEMNRAPTRFLSLTRATRIAHVRATEQSLHSVACDPVSISVQARMLMTYGDSFEHGSSINALIGNLRRLGCSSDDITAGINMAATALAPEDSAQHVRPALEQWVKQWGALQPPSTYLSQLAAAAVAAMGLTSVQGRPVGYVQTHLVELRPSPVAGTGLFARAHIPQGTVLGTYPGYIRTAAEVQLKVATAPLTAQYVFQLSSGRYLDPTDAQGRPSQWPAPGVLWPPTNPALAFVNEPPKGSSGTNCFVQDGAEDHELCFVTNRDIQANEEIFIDYGVKYNRSSYARQ